jgi:2-polyprenyl-3-methyl-5-hydroxy-6-metoxy-1,4-benzoquinol methylase
MKDKTSPKCPFCDSSILLDNVARNFAFKDSHSISFCTACELYFFSKMPSKFYLENYYSKEYFSEFDNSFLRYWSKSWLANIRATNQYKFILENLKANTKNSSILECGSSDGTFLNQFKKNGWSVKGLEFSLSMTRRAKKRFNIDLESLDIMEISPKNGLFDVIALPHVLEHMLDPVSIIRHCITLLKPNGIIFVEFPYSPLPSEVSSDMLNDYSDSTHIYNFRIKSSEKLVNLSNSNMNSLDRYFYNLPFLSSAKSFMVSEILMKGYIGKNKFISLIYLFYGLVLININHFLFRSGTHQIDINESWKGFGDNIRIIISNN